MPLKLTLNIPDRVVNAIAEDNAYNPQGAETKEQFVERIIRESLKRQAMEHEAREAAKKAEAAALSKAQSEISV